jgi:hypothetical protein
MEFLNMVIASRDLHCFMEIFRHLLLDSLRNLTFYFTKLWSFNLFIWRFVLNLDGRFKIIVNDVIPVGTGAWSLYQTLSFCFLEATLVAIEYRSTNLYLIKLWLIIMRRWSRWSRFWLCIEIFIVIRCQFRINDSISILIIDFINLHHFYFEVNLGVLSYSWSLFLCSLNRREWVILRRLIWIYSRLIVRANHEIILMGLLHKCIFWHYFLLAFLIFPPFSSQLFIFFEICDWYAFEKILRITLHSGSVPLSLFYLMNLLLDNSDLFASFQVFRLVEIYMLVCVGVYVWYFLILKEIGLDIKWLRWEVWRNHFVRTI